MTSMGCAAAGMSSRISRTGSGTPRRARSLALYAESSAPVGTGLVSVVGTVSSQGARRETRWNFLRALALRAMHRFGRREKRGCCGRDRGAGGVRLLQHVPAIAIRRTVVELAIMTDRGP